MAFLVYDNYKSNSRDIFCFSLNLLVCFVVKKLIQSLKEAHELLDRHVQSINKHCELEAVVHLELDETKTECQALKDSLGKVQEETQRLEDTLKSKTKEWGDQVFKPNSGLTNTDTEYLKRVHNMQNTM